LENFLQRERERERERERKRVNDDNEGLVNDHRCDGGHTRL
jgi:hypothetical protein